MRRLTIAGLFAALTLGTLWSLRVLKPTLSVVLQPTLTGVLRPTLTGVLRPTLTGVFKPILSRVLKPAVSCLQSALLAGGPPSSHRPVVKETYSDVPWHQKLGTFAGNEIDQAIVLPYGALDPGNVSYCKTYKSQRVGGLYNKPGA